MGCCSSKPEDDHSPIPEQKAEENATPAGYKESISLLLELSDTSAKRHLVADSANDNAKQLVEFMDEIVSRRDPNLNLDTCQRSCVLHTLAVLARSTLLFPESIRLQNFDENLGKLEYERKHAKIYSKTLNNGRVVSVKVTGDPTPGQNLKEILRVHLKEVVLRAYLSHPNILPLYGAHISNSKVWIISPWMENGDLLQYRKNHRDRYLYLMSDIASGLSYLHQHQVVHGDLRAKNILISSTGRAMLTNFEVSRVLMRDPTLSNTAVAEVWWLAPEILLNPIPTHASDVWAFACTCYEMLTGETPYRHQGMSESSLLQVLDDGGQIPHKPPRLDPDEEQVWEKVLRPCWERIPTRRHTASTIVSLLSRWRNVVGDEESSEESNRLWKPERQKSNFQLDYTLVRSVLQEVQRVALARGL